MTIKQLARVFLRLQGLLFLGTVLYECVNFSSEYRTFVTNAMSPESQSYGMRIFWLGLLRTAAYGVFALVLLAKTDRVISFLAGNPEVGGQDCHR
jgi:hypothetical protein